MTRRPALFLISASLTLLVLAVGSRPQAAGRVEHRLYSAEPGIRDYTDLGGSGILVFDIDHDYKLLKRIPLPNPKSGMAKAEAIKGVCASAKTGRLYASTPTRLMCLDLKTESVLWDRSYPGGCDRMSITPDGRSLYVPSLEGPHWHVIDGATGDVIRKIELNSGSHNTICGLGGQRAYLAGLKSPWLAVADTRTQEVVQKVGPFSNVIRPFTVNGAETRCYVNVNELLGFEVGDLKSGKMLYQVKVQGYEQGPVKRHGCPSHGVGLTPDEKELWLSDGHNNRIHVFDNTLTPPKQIASISLRDQPGWVTFSLDGKWAWPSTGEVIDVKSKKIVHRLSDEAGREVHSEKVVEVDWQDGQPLRTGDQFGLGRKLR